MVTLLYSTRPPHRAAASPDGDDLWLSATELTAATGWELKPEGLCLADRCVRIPHETGLVRDGKVNVSAFAALLDQPVIRDTAHGVWSFGEASSARRAAMQSLEAPDFTLPDLDGRLHSLSDYRGKKIFLVSWASW
jgi:hypothetical protein